MLRQSVNTNQLAAPSSSPCWWNKKPGRRDKRRDQLQVSLNTSVKAFPPSGWGRWGTGSSCCDQLETVLTAQKTATWSSCHDRDTLLYDCSNRHKNNLLRNCLLKGAMLPLARGNTFRDETHRHAHSPHSHPHCSHTHTHTLTWFSHSLRRFSHTPSRLWKTSVEFSSKC